MLHSYPSLIQWLLFPRLGWKLRGKQAWPLKSQAGVTKRMSFRDNLVPWALSQNPVKSRSTLIVNSFLMTWWLGSSTQKMTKSMTTIHSSKYKTLCRTIGNRFKSLSLWSLPPTLKSCLPIRPDTLRGKRILKSPWKLGKWGKYSWWLSHWRLVHPAVPPSEHLSFLLPALFSSSTPLRSSTRRLSANPPDA